MQLIHLHPADKANAQLAELVDALVSNTCGKPCRFDSGAGYFTGIEYFNSGFFAFMKPG